MAYLDIVAPSTAPDLKFVDSVAVNGESLPSTQWEIAHTSLMQPSLIQFFMSKRQTDASGFNTSPNNGVFSNFLESLTKKDVPITPEKLLTKADLQKMHSQQVKICVV